MNSEQRLKKTLARCKSKRMQRSKLLNKFWNVRRKSFNNSRLSKQNKSARLNSNRPRNASSSKNKHSI